MLREPSADVDACDQVELRFQSRYAMFAEQVADALKAAYDAGEDLAVASGLDDETALLLLCETLEIESMVQRLHEILTCGKTLEPFTDYKRAVLAEIMFGIADLVRELGKPEAEANTWWAAAMALLQAVAESPTASPLLWYDSIYRDLALAVRNGTPEQASQSIQWLHAALAFNIRYYDGIHVLEHLSDLAKTYAMADRFDDAIQLYVGLLRNDPSDVWLYRDVAVVLGPRGLPELGIAASERGLALLDATVDEPELRRELQDARQLLRAVPAQVPGCSPSPERLADLRAALALGFGDGEGFDPIDLCRGLVPEVDGMQVKRQMGIADLPESMRPSAKARGKSRHAGLSSACSSQDLPCWCGSGKKYRQCHQETDRAAGRCGGQGGKVC